MGANHDYIVKSNNYYRGLVDKAFKVGKATVKAKIEKDNPEFVSLQTDGWTAAHTGYIRGVCSESLHCTVLQYTALHWTVIQCNSQYCTAVNCTALHYTKLKYTKLKYNVQ